VFVDLAVAAAVIGAVAAVVALVVVPAQMRARRSEMSKARFIEDRTLYEKRRPALSRFSAELHPTVERIGRTYQLTDRSWIARHPIPLDRVTVAIGEPDVAVSVASLADRYRPFIQARLPRKPDGRQRYETRADAISELARPALWEDRPCYRLLSISVDEDNRRVELLVDKTQFFTGVDVSETLAVEALRARKSGRPKRSLRHAMGSPLELVNNPVHSSIATLTIRCDRSGEATFFLHARGHDVLDGVGQSHVIPAGVFQPSSRAPIAFKQDADIWLNIVREYVEELLAMPFASELLSGHVDYRSEQPFAELTRLRDAGTLRPYFLGVGLDPLQMQPEILTACVFDAAAFDEVFGGRMRLLRITDLEGQTYGDQYRDGELRGLPFEAETVDRLIRSGALVSGGASCLELALSQRSDLLQTSEV
jgi:hypothetical protein